MSQQSSPDCARRTSFITQYRCLVLPVLLAEDDVEDVRDTNEVEDALEEATELVEGVLETLDGELEGAGDVEDVSDELDEGLDEGGKGLLKGLDLGGDSLDNGGGKVVEGEVDGNLDAVDDVLGGLDSLDEEIDLGLGQVGDAVGDVLDGTLGDLGDGLGGVLEGAGDGIVVVLDDGDDLGRDLLDLVGDLANSLSYGKVSWCDLVLS